MATAGADSGGLGAGGKFRKKPFRRPPSKPYDRPPVSIRNPTIATGADGNTWLRKVMDPAHKLLDSTARRLFSYVFRKRLTQAPPPLHPPEVMLEAENKQESAVSLDISKEQAAASDDHQRQNLNSISGERSSVDLEEILRQKTFTSSEIDRLTAVLHAKVVSNLVEAEEKTPQALPLQSSLFHERRESAGIPVLDNGFETSLISSRGIRPNVLEEDMASPAELAKAYMGSRPSKVSTSNLGVRNQAIREDSTVFSGLVQTPKETSLALVPSSSGVAGVRENGYATPRSRGRSAIYSMARTPYSRVHAAGSLKSYGLTSNRNDGPLSPTQVSEQKENTASAKVLKRSSIFENDVGSGGPVRRIRHKPNFSYQKNWSIPTSIAGEPSSSQKRQLVGETKFNVGEQSNAASVSSRSTDMASKILKQLDKIVSPPKQRITENKLALTLENAPAKLSPSKLQGRALKSLEHIDSGKFLELVHDDDKLVTRPATESGEGRSEKQDKVEQNGPLSIFAASNNLSPSINGFESLVSNKKDAVQSPVQSGFRMSAHEDYLDMDEDDYNGKNSFMVELRGKPDTSAVEHKQNDGEAFITFGKHQTSTDAKPSRNFLTKELTEDGADGEKECTQTCTDNSPSVKVGTGSQSALPDATYSTSDLGKGTPSRDAAPLLSSAGESGPAKEQNVSASTLGFVSTDEFTTNSTDTSQLKFGASSFGALSKGNITSDSRAQNSKSAVPATGGLFSSLAKIAESDKGEEKKPLMDRVFSNSEGETAAFVSSTPLPTFTSKITSNGSMLSNPVSGDSNSVPSEKPFSIPSFPVTFNDNSNNNSGSNLLSSTSVTFSISSPAPTTFSFGSSPTLNTVSSPVATVSEEANSKADTSSGSIIGSPLRATVPTPGSFSFGISAASVISKANNQKDSVTNDTAANGAGRIPGFPAAGTVVASFTQSAPVQFGSSLSSELSTAVTAPSSGSSFNTSSAGKLFSSGTSLGSGTLPFLEASLSSPSSSGLFGQATTAASASSVTSESTSTGFSFGSLPSSSSGFTFGSAPGSSLSPSSAPVFGLSGTSPVFGTSGSSSSSSVVSLFGSTGSSSASAASPLFGTGSTTAAVSVFGSNTASSASSPFLGSMGASSGPSFSFTPVPAHPSSSGPFSFTSAASSSPAPVFGSSSSPFVFGSSSPANTNNTDQMSMEDSMAEDIVQANQGTLPSLVFGQHQAVSPPTGFAFGTNNGSGASTGAPVGANPFQFGAQQNLPGPHSPSPFQASGSLDFNSGGGSFSLGTGGGDKSGRRFIKVKKGRRK